MLLFDKVLCRVRPRWHASATEEEQACFVDVCRQTHLGDGVLIEEKLVGYCG